MKAPPSWLCELEQAINAGWRISLTYCGGRALGTARDVELKSWERYPHVFNALCLATQTLKHYRTDRVDSFAAL